MENVAENELGRKPVKKLVWKIGLPMIVSMVLQALYNVVDSVFVANIPSIGPLANEALTYAFPIQILIIAVGVGTGVGINVLLSKTLGEGNKERASRIAGNGIFLSLALYLFFLLFGLFGSRWFISLFSNNEDVIEMGSAYLTICSSLSLGALAFAIYERLLQATGKSLYSTLAQISGALINIVFDYVFIFPLRLGAEGAAWATVLGQFVSLGIAMAFHYAKNREIDGSLRYLKPSAGIIKGIYGIGISAALMQGLLSVMMAGMNFILGLADVETTLLVGSFGIYYKIQQIALFSCFGLSNTIITILSYNYGKKDKDRSLTTVKYGLLDTCLVALAITILFECVANPLSALFALGESSSSELVALTEKATRIASIGYVFMGFSVAAQGVFQALRYALRPLLTAFLRLIAFVLPIAYLFTLSPYASDIVWWTFPIAEALAALVSFFLLRDAMKKKIDPLGLERDLKEKA